jgi:hypothetical protein
LLKRLRGWLGGRQTTTDIPPDDGTNRYVEQMAARLTKLIRSSAGVSGNLPEIRAIGQRLHDRGGNDRMRDLIFEIREIDHRRDLERTIERAWDGIGNWQS